VKKRWYQCIHSQGDYFEDDSEHYIKPALFFGLVQELSQQTAPHEVILTHYKQRPTQFTGKDIDAI
jgi:hypothetical protein